MSFGFSFVGLGLIVQSSRNKLFFFLFLFWRFWGSSVWVSLFSGKRKGWNFGLEMEVSVIGSSSQAKICKTELAYRDLRFCFGKNNDKSKILSRKPNSVCFESQTARFRKARLRFTLEAVHSEAVLESKSSTGSNSVSFNYLVFGFVLEYLLFVIFFICWRGIILLRCLF